MLNNGGVWGGATRSHLSREHSIAVLDRCSNALLAKVVQQQNRQKKGNAAASETTANSN